MHALLWPLVNIATFWKLEAPLVGTTGKLHKGGFVEGQL